MKIDLTDKEIAMLTQYANVYDDERDFDGTREPIVLVQVPVWTPADSYNADKTEWFDEINHHAFTDKEELEEFLYQQLSHNAPDNSLTEKERLNLRNHVDYILALLTFDKESEYEDEHHGIHITPWNFAKSWRTVAYFLTRKEADDYVRYQGHNLTEPRVYTDCAGYSNYGDYPIAIALLKRLGEQLLQGNPEPNEKGEPNL